MPTLTKLGKYVIRRTLGKGAMGVVYEGFDPVLERTVAIKTILPSQLDGSEMDTVLARFKREAQAAGRLNHPGIVAVYEYGEVEVEDAPAPLASPDFPTAAPQRVAFIAMQFVKGRELRSYFDADERFSLKHVGRIMVEILEALDHAHSHGVTHRDIKPANLILLADGRVKIADFGIARIESSQLTVAGTVMGTPSYMSPEQFQGIAVDLRSDLFSCGVILYQFLTGEKPFVGTLTSIMFKVLREQPLPPSALNASLGPQWDRLMDKAIAKNPDDRFQSASDFAAAIRDALASQSQGEVANKQAPTAQKRIDSVASMPAPLPLPLPVPVPVPLPVPERPSAPKIDPDATFLTLADVSKALAKIKKEEVDAKLAKAAATLKAPKVPLVSEIRKIPPVPLVDSAAVPRKASLRLWFAAMLLLLILAAAGAYLWSGSGKNSVSPSAGSSPIVEKPGPPPSSTSNPTLSPPSSPTSTAPFPALSAPDSVLAVPAVPAMVPVLPLPLPASPPAPEPAPATTVESPAAVQTQPSVASAVSEPVKRLARKADVVPAPPARPVQPKPEAEHAAAERPLRRPARCALILEKAAVSEPISAEERNFLTSSCQ